VEVKDPASFDFKLYLEAKMGKTVVELVEVDSVTWVVSLILVVPFIAVVDFVSTT
tara:strand:- start:780 stop:944 length:165 start_codon:yes stop_codon:yes gene_type:complete